MNITLIEPFFSGSHKTWAEGYRQHAQHEVQLLTLPGRHWKWRMHGAAINLAQMYLDQPLDADLLLLTDLMDATSFLALSRSRTHATPTALYFHENQLTYPWSATDPDVALRRDNHYAFIQYSSALAADHLFFNSDYHRSSFLGALPDFLRQFPDHKTLDLLPSLQKKSKVLPLGLDLSYLDQHRVGRSEGPPVLLWNHRWEYDKQPDLFFQALSNLQQEGIEFRLIVLGESFSRKPDIFAKAQQLFSERIIHFGYADSKAKYAELLWQADILPVTSIQDFFGGSIVEAIYCNCLPVLPDRLAYPEHVPADLHHQYFYRSDDDFYQMLKKRILKFDPAQRQSPLREVVKKYNWCNLAPQYDAAFVACAKN